MANTLGQHNPLRYRGYVYDRELDMYYLQSRYYDSQIGRFVNADDVSLLHWALICLLIAKIIRYET